MIAFAISLCALAAAVFQDDIRFVDWSVSLFGLPQAAQTNGTHVALLGDLGRLGVVNASGGALWTRDAAGASSLALANGVLYASGGVLAAYNFTTGELLYAVQQRVECVQAAGTRVLADQFELQHRTLVSSDDGARCAPAQSPLRLGGTELKWNVHGVLEFTGAFGTQWTRDEGLAYADEARFVHTQLLGAADAEYVDMVHLLQARNASLVQAWATRVGRHTRQLVAAATHFARNFFHILLPPASVPVEFQFEQVLVVKTALGSLYGLNATNKGEVVWVYHDIEPLRLAAHANVSQFDVHTPDGVYTLSYDGEVVIGPRKARIPRGLASLAFNGTLVSSPRYGWSLHLPGDEVVATAERDPSDHTAAVAAPLDERNVLYKYLNPFTAAIATLAGETLRVTLLDTNSGRVLAQATHPDPVVVSAEWPFSLVFGEHWIAYTYLSRDSSQLPKITVWELYESETPNTRLSRREEFALQDTLAPHVVYYTFALPGPNEPVYSLTTSRTLFGAASRDVVLARRHRVDAIPKNWLSAGYVQKTLEIPERGHLSHFTDVPQASLLVTGPTGLESTYLLAALGPTIFFTRVTPSGEFDRLARTFPRLNLLSFIGMLVFAAVTLSPFVRNRHLRYQWR